jgi:hypothetical protein
METQAVRKVRASNEGLAKYKKKKKKKKKKVGAKNAIPNKFPKSGL